jgi:hypothetical protein
MGTSKVGWVNSWQSGFINNFFREVQMPVKFVQAFIEVYSDERKFIFALAPLEKLF